jgi:hypothetical protein
MYRVPSAHTLDPRLRRAIALAVALCSLGGGLLLQIIIDLEAYDRFLIGLGVYFGLIALCGLAASKGWIKGLHTLAVLGLALGIVCLALQFIAVFNITSDTPWNWGKLILPAAFLGFSITYIGAFWKRAARIV